MGSSRRCAARRRRRGCYVAEPGVCLPDHTGWFRTWPDAAKYKAADIGRACSSFAGLQYLEANTRHFENTFRANMLIGGFHLSPTDGNLRIDATATAVTGLLRFLASGAEARVNVAANCRTRVLA